MPPRKSNVSVTTNGDGDTSTAQVTSKPRESIGVEDLALPRTMIQRLAKGVLPSNTQIQKDALLALSKSATVFINFIAAAASDNATDAGKKTIMPHDVFAALKEQEFEAFLPQVQEEVAKYNEIQSSKRNNYRRTKKAEKVAGDGEGETMDGSLSGEGGDKATNGVGHDDERPSKKVRREPGEEGGDEDVDDVEDVEDEAEDSADEDVEEDEVEEEEVVEEVEEEEGDDEGGEMLNGIRDEALDEPDSD